MITSTPDHFLRDFELPGDPSSGEADVDKPPFREYLNGLKTDIQSNQTSINSVDSVLGVVLERQEQQEFLAESGQLFRNAVRGRFHASDKINDNPNIGYFNSSHEIQARGVISFKSAPLELSALTNQRQILEVDFGGFVSDAYPAFHWFIPKSDLELVGSNVIGTGVDATPPAANIERYDIKFGIINSYMAKFESLDQWDIGFGLAYATPGAEELLIADPSFVASEMLYFQQNDVAGTNGFGEPSGQPNAPNPLFWADGSSAGDITDPEGLLTTFWWKNFPIPLNWGNRVFVGLKLRVRANAIDTESAPITIGVTNFGVSNVSNEMFGASGIDYYNPLFNFEDILDSSSVDLSEVQEEVVAVMGSSHAFNDTLGVLREDFFPQQYADMLPGRKRVENAGISGDPTSNMPARMPALLATNPTIVLISANRANDLGSTTTVDAGTHTTGSMTIVDNTDRYDAGGWITVDGTPIQIETVDQVTRVVTFKTLLSFVPVAGMEVLVASQLNLEELVNLCYASGVYDVVIIGQLYINQVGGDTPTVQKSSAEFTRTYQKAAALNTRAVYVDVYEFIADAINRGLIVQGDWAALHVSDTDAHPNAGGGLWFARAINYTLTKLARGVSL